jgi:phasin family protein
MIAQVPEQFVAAQKSGIDALFGFLNAAYPGAEKLVDLNVQAAKASLAENHAVLSEAVSAKDPQALLELQRRQTALTNEKAQAYWRHVNEIVTETRSQLLAQSQKQVSEYVRETQALADNLGKNTPMQSGTFAAFWSKSFEAMRDAGAAFQQQTMGATKEAVEVVDKAGKVVTARP